MNSISWYYSYYKFKLKRFVKNNWKSLLKLTIWLILGYIFYKFEFTIIFIILTAIYLMFSNLDWDGKKKELSAYSVFNKDCKQLPGQLTPDAFMNELHIPRRRIIQEKPNIMKETKIVGRNDICPCGSKRRFKHCCIGKI
jgi:hypothetical protein